MKIEYRNLTKSEIKKAQSYQLIMLDEIDRICKLKAINYSLFHATLIGAVRERKFLEWDDDLDIVMIEDDYRRFEDVFRQNLSNRFCLQSSDSDSEFLNPFISKIRMNGTVLSELGERNSDCCGVWVDIYRCLPLKNKIDVLKARKLFNKLMVKIRYRYQYMFYSLGGFLKNSLIKISFPWGKKRCFKKYTNVFKKEICSLRDAKYIAIPFKFNNKAHFIEDVSLFRNFSTVEFCGKEYSVVARKEDLLRLFYGNYLNPPEEKDRVSHHKFVKIKL